MRAVISTECGHTTNKEETMSIEDTKQLTDREMIEIIASAPDEIECADAYRHFLEDLGTLIADHFGGERGMVTEPDTLPETRIAYICDNCEKIHDFPEQVIPLFKMEDLSLRLTVGSEVPHGECHECGAMVYKRELLESPGEMEWMCGFHHNECVPEDGWVYSRYDKDINWNQSKPQPS